LSQRKLLVREGLWTSTWEGLRVRGWGRREAACVWVGDREGSIERARDVIFLDDLPGTVGRPLQHRTSREAVAALLARARDLGMMIVADIHTHPSDWVDLSVVDRAHQIEYRVGLLALVLPHFATTPPTLHEVGVHEYAGDGEWATFDLPHIADRVHIVAESERA